MSEFHVDVTRHGAGWLVHVEELSRSTTAAHHGEITARTDDLIRSATGEGDDEIDVILRSERDVIRTRATRLGFELELDGPVRTDTFRLSGKARLVSVRYDDHGAVVDVDASAQFAAYQPTRDGALEALLYTAEYSDIKLRRLKIDSPE